MREVVKAGKAAPTARLLSGTPRHPVTYMSTKKSPQLRWLACGGEAGSASPVISSTSCLCKR